MSLLWWVINAWIWWVAAWARWTVMWHLIACSLLLCFYFLLETGNFTLQHLYIVQIWLNIWYLQHGRYATSMTLSTNCASSSIGVSSFVEAITMQTFIGRHCKNSYWIKTPSFITVSSASCWKLWRNCVDFLSKSSSAFSNCWICCCGDTAIQWMSFSFRLVYWFLMGDDKMRSQISGAMSGDNDATMYSYMVCW